jgi:hypothetical protein
METRVMRFEREVMVTFWIAAFSFFLLNDILQDVAAWEDVLIVILMRMRDNTVAVKQRRG